ncbi:MAG TPA: AI-2E family transporter [Gemmatimonadaceae bacterium]
MEDPVRRERRRAERRFNHRVVDLTLPELRRILLTTMLSFVVLALFIWMVRSVIIAAILGVVIAYYMRPVHEWVTRRIRSTSLAAILTLLFLIVPVLGILAYSYWELADVAAYVGTHQQEIAAKIDLSLRRLPFMQAANTGDFVRRAVLEASRYGARIPLTVRAALASFTVAATIFLFTAFYVFVDGRQLATYVRSKVPPRYDQLVGALETNVRGVLSGAIYSTLVTQTTKSLLLLVMFVIFGVPLAGVLSVLSFVVGFFPIVGSWSVYLPVAAWLLVFRDNAIGALLLAITGFVVNTLFISNYLRPKLAADRSRVLNFYWMFVGLVTGVYTFGLAGILLGPILIGLLKALVDTITVSTNWRLLDDGSEGDGEEAGASP